jgi:hypothetical protein
MWLLLSITFMQKMLQSCANHQEGGESYRNLGCTAMPQGLAMGVGAYGRQSRIGIPASGSVAGLPLPLAVANRSYLYTLRA